MDIEDFAGCCETKAVTAKIMNYSDFLHLESFVSVYQLNKLLVNSGERPYFAPVVCARFDRDRNEIGFKYDWTEDVEFKYFNT